VRNGGDAKNRVPGYASNSPSRTRTSNLAVNPPAADRKAQKSIVFSILASFWIFARVRILSRFFASYRGIRSAKRYETVVVFWHPHLMEIDSLPPSYQTGGETIIFHIAVS
jgi:hypothetical protein